MTAQTFDWWKTARFMLISRALDQLEVERLTPQGKVKYQFSASGHELAQVLLAQAMDHPHDAATVYYRSRPFMLASGMTPLKPCGRNGSSRQPHGRSGCRGDVQPADSQRSNHFASVRRCWSAVYPGRRMGTGHSIPVNQCFLKEIGKGQ